MSLFILRDAYSNSITRLFRACLFVALGGGIAQLSRIWIATWGILSHRCVCAKLSIKGGYRAMLGEC